MFSFSLSLYKMWRQQKDLAEEVEAEEVALRVDKKRTIKLQSW